MPAGWSCSQRGCVPSAEGSVKEERMVSVEEVGKVWEKSALEKGGDAK